MLNEKLIRRIIKASEINRKFIEFYSMRMKAEQLYQKELAELNAMLPDSDSKAQKMIADARQRFSMQMSQHEKDAAKNKQDYINYCAETNQKYDRQRSEAMRQVKKLSGNGEIILRPMCAKLLPPSLPEINGWVDREKLEAINGRSRARQTELATLFGFSEWASAGGGCPYTDKGFSARIRDWMAHEGKGREMDELDIQSLRYGRHLRLGSGAKLIIGRDERENNALLELFNSGLNKQYMKAQIDNFTGAFVLVSKSADESEREL